MSSMYLLSKETQNKQTNESEARGAELKETLNKQTNEEGEARRAEPEPNGRAKRFVERRKSCIENEPVKHSQ